MRSAICVSIVEIENMPGGGVGDRGLAERVSPSTRRCWRYVLLVCRMTNLPWPGHWSDSSPSGPTMEQLFREKTPVAIAGAPDRW